MNTLSKTLLVSATALTISACGSDSQAPNVPTPGPADTTAPAIAQISAKQIAADSSSEPITLRLSDNKSTAEQLALLVTSSNQSLIPDQGLVISGDGAERSLVVTPVPDSIGSANIMLSVTDEANNEATSMFAANVSAKPVSARLFVNDVLILGENQDAALVNGIELIQDIDNDTEFDHLLDQ